MAQAYGNARCHMSLPVSVLVLAENYDDHNRHGRRLML